MMMTMRVWCRWAGVAGNAREPCVSCTITPDVVSGAVPSRQCGIKGGRWFTYDRCKLQRIGAPFTHFLDDSAPKATLYTCMIVRLVAEGRRSQRVCTRHGSLSRPCLGAGAAAGTGAGARVPNRGDEQWVSTVKTSSITIVLCGTCQGKLYYAVRCYPSSMPRMRHTGRNPPSSRRHCLRIEGNARGRGGASTNQAGGRTHILLLLLLILPLLLLRW